MTGLHCCRSGMYCRMTDLYCCMLGLYCRMTGLYCCWHICPQPMGGLCQGDEEGEVIQGHGLQQVP